MSTTIKGRWEQGEHFGYPELTYSANGATLARIVYRYDCHRPPYGLLFLVETIDDPVRVKVATDFATFEDAVEHVYFEADEWFNQLDAGLTMTHPDDCGFRVEGDTFKKIGGE